VSDEAIKRNIISGIALYNHMRTIFCFIGILAVILLGLTPVQAQQLRTVQQIEGIPPKVEYRAITHDASGNVYVATSADVFKIPSNSSRALPMSAGGTIVDVHWSKEYGLLMLSSDGEIHFTASGQTLSIDAGSAATCMDVSKSTIWVGTHKGVYTVSIPQEKIIDHYSTADGVLASDEINFIHSDPYGIRWVGTNAGVARIQGKKWKLYERGQAVTAITSTGEGAWMAADQNMWLVDSYNRWFPIDAWRDLVSGRVKALSSDASGTIFIASDILVKYDPYRERIVTMNESGTPEEAILLSQGPDRNVWLAGHNGLARIVEDTARIVEVISEDNALAAVVEVRSLPVCPGTSTGHLAVKVAGGVPPYHYAWSQNAGSAAEATGLKPGVYQVTVTDQSGQTMVAGETVHAAQALQLTTALSGKASDKLANDGQATVTVKGGVPPYQFSWSNGEATQKAVTLPEGEHTIRVTDDYGCTATASVRIEADRVLKTLDINTISLGQTIRVDNLYFEADSSAMSPSSFAVLEEIYEFLSQHNNVVIEVGGHTNSLPADDYCDKLSTARAQHIAEYLYNKGISQNRVSFKGYGKRNPVATNATAEGRRRNQRVEIKIVSL
jgi:outer membrane protein OmpA-like peptidoglycan-associated protein